VTAKSLAAANQAAVRVVQVRAAASLKIAAVRRAAVVRKEAAAQASKSARQLGPSMTAGRVLELNSPLLPLNASIGFFG
jgi:hypothetical protein